MKYITSVAATIVLSLAVFMTIAPHVTEAFNPFGDVCTAGSTATVCQEQQAQSAADSNPISGPNGILIKAARIISIAVGVASVVMIIIGGFKYVTSSGDANNITSAKNTILYAIVGLVIALMAQAIISLIVNRILR